MLIWFRQEGMHHCLVKLLRQNKSIEERVSVVSSGLELAAKTLLPLIPTIAISGALNVQEV